MRALVLLALCARVASAQPSADLVMAGDRESAARRPAQALPLFERAVAADPRNYTALWKASRELVDLGEFEANATTRSGYYLSLIHI